MLINIKLIEEGKLPKKSRLNDAGYDCFCREWKYDTKTDATYIKLGFAIEIPEGYVGLIFPRSSQVETDNYAPNSIGVIDPNYRGEVMYVIKNRNYLHMPEKPQLGEKVCQFLIIKNEDIEFLEVPELSETERGVQGFGSSGKF